MISVATPSTSGEFNIIVVVATRLMQTVSANNCVKCTRIAEIIASYRKSGSRNTMVTSDFRPEVEI